MTPNVDRNKAPETWITAAPQDTITLRDDEGNPVRPLPGTIAARFHLYWAGADEDGEVAGFYFAVVETLPQAPDEGQPIPHLPGPKPRDYRFTRRTDSTFVFRVSEFSPDRQHAFFIYAVDDRGKADPTPARFMFNALDRFPPLPLMELNRDAKATGFLYRLRGDGTVAREPAVVFINDSLAGNIGLPPRDTVPLGSRLDFSWRGEPTVGGSFVAGFKYKLDEPGFISADPSVRAVSYNTGVGGDVIREGDKVFTLRALNEAGGMREITRRFQMNYAPDTWFSGPDPSLYPRDPGTGDRFVNVNWSNLPEFPGSLLSCDSLGLWPAERPERRTFFELYKNRVYIRGENDTVHMNSWVILHSGGTDRDSPYDVHVSSNDPTLPDSTRCGGRIRVVRPGPPNGSPVGFRQQYAMYMDPDGTPSLPSQSGVYPIFDAASVFRAPTIGGYGSLFQSGKVYAVTRAEDGNGAQDRRIPFARDLADRVDRGQGTPAEVALRRKVLTFYVNKPPRLTLGAGDFFPRPNDTLRTTQLRLNLRAEDDDPYDPENPPRGVGGPSDNPVLRRRVQVKAVDASGATVLYPSRPDSGFAARVDIDRPPNLPTSGVDTVKVQLCDCANCELIPGVGRCVSYNIPLVVRLPAPGLAPPSAATSQPGPGPSNGGSRSGNR